MMRRLSDGALFLYRTQLIPILRQTRVALICSKHALSWAVVFQVESIADTIAIALPMRYFCGKLSYLERVHLFECEYELTAVGDIYWLALQSAYGILTLVYAGSHSECMYRLMSFGMPISDCPMSETGELKRGNHLKWIERRRKKEFYLTSGVAVGHAVDIPAKCDVPYYLAEGNLSISIGETNDSLRLWLIVTRNMTDVIDPRRPNWFRKSSIMYTITVVTS